MNWWLVANHLKHGMMTVRPVGAGGHDHAAMSGMAPMAHGGPAMSPMSMQEAQAPRPSMVVMTVLSFVALAAGFAIAVLLAPR